MVQGPDVNKVSLGGSLKEPFPKKTFLFKMHSVKKVINNNKMLLYFEPHLFHAVTYFKPQLSHAVKYFEPISHATPFWLQNHANIILTPF